MLTLGLFNTVFMVVLLAIIIRMRERIYDLESKVSNLYESQAREHVKKYEHFNPKKQEPEVH